MSLLANFLTLAFVLGMAALWSTYGLFSGFLNLVIVLCAGALAFATWEPTAYTLLDWGMMTGWGVGLLLPFLFYYAVMRIGLDVLIRRNVDSWPLANQIGGGAMGAVSGTLIAGILVIGLGYLTPEARFMGIQPYKVERGAILPNPSSPSLWLPADRIAGATFESLGGGSLAPTGQKFNLANVRGQPAARAAWSRLTAPEQAEASRFASPAGVQVDKVYTYNVNPQTSKQLLAYGAAMALLKDGAKLPDGRTPEELLVEVAKIVKEASETPEGAVSAFKSAYLEKTRANLNLRATAAGDDILSALVTFEVDCVTGTNADGKRAAPDKAVQAEADLFAEDTRWVVVNTVWKKKDSNAYDEGSLRLAAAQARLVVSDGPGKPAKELLPIAWSTGLTSSDTGRELVAFTTAAFGTRPADPEHVALVYRVPGNAEPLAIYLRELRLPIAGAPLATPKELASLLGHILPTNVQGAVVAAPSAMPSGEYGVFAHTPALPRPISTVEQTGMVLHDNPQKNRALNLLAAGKFRSLAASTANALNKQRADDLSVPSTVHCLRLEMNYRQYRSLFGQAIGLAEGITPIALLSEGGPIQGVGYAVLRANRDMDVDIHPNAPGVSKRDFAELRPEMGEGDRAFVYFYIPKDAVLTGLTTGAGSNYTFKEPLNAASLGQ